MFNIIGHKYIYLVFSGVLVVASFAALFIWGLKQGIDFTGGSLLEVEYLRERPSVEAVKSSLAPLNLGDLIVQPSGDREMILRFQPIDEATHQKIISALAAASAQSLLSEKQFNTVGPTIGKELKQKSILALIIASLGIILYLAWAFRNVSKPLASWKYGVIAVLVAFLHDVPIPAGIFAILGHYKGIEVDPLFITALLTILGFSVHDTIVVFDRTRENLRKLKVPEPYEVTVNRSVNETLTRSINTSLTVLLVLTAIFFLGGATTKYFALALIVGVIFGTYSSIFVASPLAVIWNQLRIRKNK